MGTISAIITVYNEEPFIAAAIDSVLAQHQAVNEIVVVSDASTDGSQTVIETYAAKYPSLIRPLFLTKNSGAPFARNAGAKQAHGELLAFLDGDDLWLPDKLQVQHEILLQHPEAGYTYGSAIEFYDHRPNPEAEQLRCPTGVYLPPDLCIGYLKHNYCNFWPSGLLIRRASFHLSGGFIEVLGAYQHWEDYFYACVLALQDAAFVLDRPLTYYRVHEASCSQRALATKKTIVDERMGLEWFLRYLLKNVSQTPSDMLRALGERLTRNIHEYTEAAAPGSELAKYSKLYSPAAIESVWACMRKLGYAAGQGCL